MAKQFITRAAFESWLKSKQPTDTVGTAKDPCDCPLATCIVQTLPRSPNQNGYCQVTVDSNITVALYSEDGDWMESIRKQQFANWMEQFMVKIDRFETINNHISASIALQVLESV